MTTHKEPSPEALANVTEGNVASCAELLPEEAEMKGSGLRMYVRAVAAVDGQRVVKRPERHADVTKSNHANH